MATFERCSHCGEQFFKTDLHRTKNGPICMICLERGACRVNGD